MQAVNFSIKLGKNVIFIAVTVYPSTLIERVLTRFGITKGYTLQVSSETTFKVDFVGEIVNTLDLDLDATIIVAPASFQN